MAKRSSFWLLSLPILDPCFQFSFNPMTRVKIFLSFRVLITIELDWYKKFCINIDYLKPKIGNMILPSFIFTC